ncbi:MAG: FAD-dependent oxidoreductase, partial [Euryarchaeota archaeon]|nr:FAD-dependent oxidoreductase [Euryarchaeota archaeon]
MTEYDVVIVGGGVAGLSAGIFTARAGLETLIVDQGRSILARNALLENYPGFPIGINPRRFLDMVEAQARHEQWLTAAMRELDSQWGYRRRARLSVKYVHKKGRVLVGFRERDGRFVADLRSCPVLTPEVGERLLELSELIFGMDARTRIPQIEIASGDQQTLLVVRHLEPLSDADLQRLRDFSVSSGLGIVLQAKGPKSLVGLDGQSLELTYTVDSEDL